MPDSILNQEEIEKIASGISGKDMTNPYEQGRCFIQAGYNYALSKLRVSDEKLVELLPLADTSHRRFKPNHKGWSSCIQCEKNMAETQRAMDVEKFSPYLTLKKQEVRKEERERIIKIVIEHGACLGDKIIGETTPDKCKFPDDCLECYRSILNKDGG